LDSYLKLQVSALRDAFSILPVVDRFL